MSTGGVVALTAIKKSACSSSLGNLRQLELTGRMQIRFGPVIMKSDFFFFFFLTDRLNNSHNAN